MPLTRWTTLYKTMSGPTQSYYTTQRVKVATAIDLPSKNKSLNIYTNCVCRRILHTSVFELAQPLGIRVCSQIAIFMRNCNMLPLVY